jgi:ribosomal protein S20
LKKEILTKLVNDGTITQDQADAVLAALQSADSAKTNARTKEEDQYSNSSLSSVLKSLVKKKTITQKQANAIKKAFAQADKTVVSKGEDVVLRLDTGTRTPSRADLNITIRSGNVKAQPSTASFTIPKGMNRFDLKLSTAALEPGSYHAEITIKNGDVTAIEQSVPFYVVQ